MTSNTANKDNLFCLIDHSLQHRSNLCSDDEGSVMTTGMLCLSRYCSRLTNLADLSGTELRLEPQAGGLRRRSRKPAKKSREMAVVDEALARADLDERDFTFGQQRLGALDSEFDQILVRGRARRSLELAREMEDRHLGHTGQFREAQVAFVIVGDEGQHAPQPAAGQSAREPLRAIARRRVMTEQVNGQNVRQRLGVETTARSLRFKLRQQRHPDTLHDRVARRASFDDLDGAACSCARLVRRAQDQRRLKVDRELFRVAPDTGPEGLPGRNHAHAAVRLAARLKSARRAYHTLAAALEREHDEMISMTMLGQISLAPAVMFEPDAFPGSSPLEHDRRAVCPIGCVHLQESLSTCAGAATTFLLRRRQERRATPR